MGFRDRLRWQEQKLQADARSRNTDEGIARLGKDIAKQLENAADKAREQLEEDRKTIAGIIESLRGIVESGRRIEDASAVVAEDLKQSHERADAVLESDPAPGEAADEAARSPKEED